MKADTKEYTNNRPLAEKDGGVHIQCINIIHIFSLSTRLFKGLCKSRIYIDILYAFYTGIRERSAMRSLHEATVEPTGADETANKAAGISNSQEKKTVRCYVYIHIVLSLIDSILYYTSTACCPVIRHAFRRCNSLTSGERFSRGSRIVYTWNDSGTRFNESPKAPGSRLKAFWQIFFNRSRTFLKCGYK